MPQSERQPLSDVVDAAIPVVRRVVDTLVQYYARPLTVTGEQNLDRALRMAEDGGGLLGEPNHTSNADGAILETVLRNLGVDNAIYVMGIRLENNPVSNLLTNGVNTIRIWPDTIEPQNEEEKQEKIRRNFRAVRGVNEALKNKKPVILFPEGGRSRREDGLITPDYDVGRFIRRQRVILPIGIIGSREVLPVGRTIPVRGPVEIRFGSPIRSDQLIKKYDNLNMHYKLIAMMEDIMKCIAVLLPPEYQGVYRNRI